jgi:hypothetical protein
MINGAGHKRPTERAHMTVHEVLNEERKRINALTAREGLPASQAAEYVADERDVKELLRSLDNALTM